MPPGDTFQAPSRTYEIAFRCCGAREAGLENRGTASKGLDTMVLLMGGSALFVFFALLSGAFYMKSCSNRKAIAQPAFKAAGAASAAFQPNTATVGPDPR